MCTTCVHIFSVDSEVDGPIAVPHLVPLLMAMEGDDPVEDSERGCQLLYNVLQSARNAALHAQDYQQQAHSLLTGTVCMHVTFHRHSYRAGASCKNITSQYFIPNLFIL